MSQIPMVGKGGFIEIGGEQLKFNSWTFDPAKISELNECFDAFSRSIISALNVFQKPLISTLATVPFFAKMEARRLRKLRKKWKRYQLQKRKQ